ncbi:MAG TPA: hypothetical protein V6D28_14015 [Leptolyngbyaceae cyanobacterium]
MSWIRKSLSITTLTVGLSLELLIIPGFPIPMKNQYLKPYQDPNMTDKWEISQPYDVLQDLLTNQVSSYS